MEVPFSSNDLTLLIRLILAHAVSDYFLQFTSWVEDKRLRKIRSVKLYYHILVTFLSAFVFSLNAGAALFIALTHYGIDLGKIYMAGHRYRFRTFILDQALHFIVIIVVWLHLTDNYDSLRGLISTKTPGLTFWAIILGYTLVTFPLGVVIDIFIHRWRMEIENITNEKIISLSEAGKWIGIMERTLILTFILSNQFAGIGFLIAAKAILRFRDSDIKQAEYVLIGTLMSFTSTILIGIGIRFLTEI